MRLFVARVPIKNMSESVEGLGSAGIDDIVAVWDSDESGGSWVGIWTNVCGYFSVIVESDDTDCFSCFFMSCLVSPHSETFLLAWSSNWPDFAAMCFSVVTSPFR